MTFYDYIINYIKNYEYSTNEYPTQINYCFKIRKACVESNGILNKELERNIDLLIKDKDYLLELEFSLHKKMPEFYSQQFSHILKVLSHYENKKINRASSFIIGDNEFRCIELYLINKELTKELINSLLVSYEKLKPSSQKANFKELRRIILKSNVFQNSSSLVELADNIIIENNLDTKERANLSHLYGQKKIIEIFGVPHDITKYYKLNTIVLEQYEKIRKYIKNKTDFMKFVRFSAVINNHLIKHNNDEIYFKEHGLLGLTANNYEVLKKIRDSVQTKQFNFVVFILNILTENNFNYLDYDHRCLYVQNEYTTPYEIRLAKLYEKSEIFALQFYELFKEYLKKIDYKELNEVTIRTYITTLRKLFIENFSKEELDKHGLDILFVDDCIHFKALKAKIYEDRLQNKILLTTQVHNYISLKFYAKF